MIDDRAVETVQTALAETRWLPVPCPTEYLPALARDILYALEKAGMSVVQLPEPDDDGEWYEDTWYVNADTDMPSHQKLRVNVPQMHMAPTAARRFAAALLAAAVVAESVSVAPQEQP